MLSALLNMKEVRLNNKLEERCDQVLADILRIWKLFSVKQPTARAGQFEWVDSPLVKVSFCSRSMYLPLLSCLNVR